MASAASADERLHVTELSLGLCRLSAPGERAQPAPNTLHLRGLSKPAAHKPRHGGAMKYFNRAAGVWRRGRPGDGDGASDPSELS